MQVILSNVAIGFALKFSTWTNLARAGAGDNARTH
jgi:hypothetical protein